MPRTTDLNRVASLEETIVKVSALIWGECRLLFRDLYGNDK